MGIPGFNRWLRHCCPSAISNVQEEEPRWFLNGQKVPIDTTTRNPNGFEFDNFYLDVNSLVHPCFHPEDPNQPQPNSYDEVFKAIFKYIDRVFSIVQPRKLLFMAIDGVAPRAKMNQQRSRRFRAAKEAADVATEAEKLKDEYETTCDKMDPNVITPGTEFMASLSVAMQYYIQLRLNNDPGWRRIKVILSDANVPGEGEHKVISYIRAQRNLPGFDPNTRHCFYGLDADLIMLALATHEIHFSILREDAQVMRFRLKKARKDAKRQKSRFPNSKVWKAEGNDSDYIERIKFQFVHIWILRQYLEFELKIPGVLTDLERLIDDFVLMCLFVGNDFLPHIPLLEMSEGTINLLMKTYRNEFSKMGGYLTNSFEVDLGRVEHFLQVVGSHETAILRKKLKKRKVKSSKDACDGDQDDGMGWMVGHNIPKSVSQHSSQNELSNGEKKVKVRAAEGDSRGRYYCEKSDIDAPNDLTKQKDHMVVGHDIPESVSQHMSQNEVSNCEKKDKVRAIKEEWKERYYCEKFDIDASNDLTKHKDHMVQKYVEGLCWFMHYYYQGICSWQWFYPYHYAPFASDFINLKSLDISFTLGKPFKPFDQLMSVLPAASAHALPLSYRKLMTDPSSSIKDFYPQDFALDMNGKEVRWQAVCKLPFIEESRLLQEIESVEHNLTDAERRRNAFSLDSLFLHITHHMAPKIISFYKKKKDSPKLAKAKLMQKIKPKLSDGMNGSIYISDKTIQSSEMYSPIDEMKTIKDNQTIFVYYKGPPTHPHIPRVPEGARLPEKCLLNKLEKKACQVERKARLKALELEQKAQGLLLLQKEGENTVKEDNILGKRKRKWRR